MAEEQPGQVDPLTETLVVLRDALDFLLEQEVGRLKGKTSPEALLRAQRLRAELRRVLGSGGDLS